MDFFASNSEDTLPLTLYGNAPIGLKEGNKRRRIMATEEDQQILAVGVIGCARIAKKNCTAANKEFASCTIKSIASRNADKASAFINEVFVNSAQRPTQIFTGKDAYKDLLETKESCEAVYIPLPTKLHQNMLQWRSVIKNMSYWKNRWLYLPRHTVTCYPLLQRKASF